MIHLTTLISRNGVMTTLMFLTGESGEELVGYSLMILILRRVKLALSLFQAVQTPLCLLTSQ